MSEDPPPRPLDGLLTQALEGQLSVNLGQGAPDEVRANAEEFVYIERDCEGFKLLIRELQRKTEDIADRERWDLGEKDMDSAKIVVGRFRAKAKGAEDGNAVFEVLEQHYRIVEDIQELHRVIAQRYMETDDAFAARYNELMGAAPPSAPLTLPPPIAIPPGTALG
ncbi:hypothetical protein [Nocardia flavorosea]|uniref:hypothetical protein n=1 Tax=Nocardia flavorosea TaxID=53429 RepID=UPI002453B801|nr:hypothetical protein [Nocardia flavorosea]